MDNYNVINDYNKLLYEYKINEDNIKDTFDLKINNLKKEIEEITIKKSLKLYENKLKYSNYINDDNGKQLLKAWFDYMLNYCHQGTFGYKVSWENVPESIFGIYTSTPHHWICKPEYYEKIKLSSKLNFYCKLNNISIVIANKPEKIYWGN